MMTMCFRPPGAQSHCPEGRGKCAGSCSLAGPCPSKAHWARGEAGKAVRPLGGCPENCTAKVGWAPKGWAAGFMDMP